MTDVVIVGAGPGGLSAAIEAASRGLGVVVLDEQHQPGGRLPGQLHEDARARRWVSGADEARHLAREAERAGVEVRLGASVWALARADDGAWVASASLDGPGEDAIEVSARAAIVATGAAEHPHPVPGWTLPGVITVGAAQVLAQVHRVLPGRTAVVIGVDALSLGIARQLALAGVDVRAIVMPPAGALAGPAGDPESVLAMLADLADLAPSPVLRVAGRIGRTALGSRLAPHLYPRRGVRAWGMPVQVRRAAVHIEGESRAEAVRVRAIDPAGAPTGPAEWIGCDVVCLGGGLHPLVDLAAAAGARTAWIDELGGEVPLHDEWLETSEPGLFVTGNATGVEGAAVAGAHGRLAGVGVARQLGAIDEAGASARAAEVRSQIVEARASAPIRFYPDVERGRARVTRRGAREAPPRR